MPLDGSNVASKPAGTTAVPNTVVASAPYNAVVDDIYNIFNTKVQGVGGGGSGATTAIGAHDAFVTKGADIPTNATLNLDTATGAFDDLTGTTTITAVTLGAGKHRMTRAAGDFQITVSASLIGNNAGSNIAVKTGDLIFWEGYAAGVVRFWVVPVNGQPVSNILRQSATPTPTVEGEMWWDTDDDTIAIGNGVGTSIFKRGPVLHPGIDLTITPSFTALPTGIISFTVSFIGLSTNGTTAPRLQLGTSAGLVTTGYVTRITAKSETPAIVIDSVTGGIPMKFAGWAATITMTGTLQFTRLGSGGNIWSVFGLMGRTETDEAYEVIGNVTLPGPLDRLTFAIGADTFDSGNAGLLYTF
jgi:hypothetical protein